MACNQRQEATIGRNELADAVYQALNGEVSRARAKRITDAVIEELIEAIVRDEHLKLARFGRFAVLHKSVRPGRNPTTGEFHTIPAQKSVSFYPAPALTEAVNRRNI